MQVGSEQWLALLIRGAAQMGIAVTPSQAIQMARHAQALLEWNRKINLTAITDPEQVGIKHFIDAIIPMMHIPEQGELLDLGTGGGFPGIPLKVMRPHQPMTLIDASRKKINFVKHVLRQLALPKIEALQSRVEALGQQAVHQGRFQIIVSRAFADLDQIARAAGALLAPNGKIFVYQGPNEEVRHIKEGSVIGHLRLLYTFVYELPMIGDSRTLVVMG